MNGPQAGPPTRYAPLTAARAALVCGVVAGPVFIVTFTAAGAARTGYDPMRHPVSSLALGPHGWVQTANFWVAGVLYLVFAVGLWMGPTSRARPRLGTLLVGVAAVGLIGAGIFPTDPISGYPPGTPDRSDGYSGPEALLHDVFSAPVFLGLPVAAQSWARVYRRRGSRGWALYSMCSGVAMFVMFVLAAAAFAQTLALVDLGGLFQRVCLTIGMGWLTTMAAEILRAPGPGTSRRPERTRPSHRRTNQ
jgi:hypothetical protein